MKRLHVHVGVTDLARSIRFYSTLFGSTPTVTKDEYAKWMLEDPRVNFAISAGDHAARGIEHLGIQVENADELGQVYDRLKAADRPVIDEGATTCCYAQSEKSWISDPDGVVWEAFLTSGKATIYGDSPQLSAVSDGASKDTCCAPSLPAAAAATPSCCGLKHSARAVPAVAVAKVDAAPSMAAVVAELAAVQAQLGQLGDQLALDATVLANHSEVQLLDAAGQRIGRIVAALRGAAR